MKDEIFRAIAWVLFLLIVSLMPFAVAVEIGALTAPKALIAWLVLIAFAFLVAELIVRRSP